MSHHKVVSTLTDVLSDTSKEKLIRIIVAVFRNLLEQPNDPMISQLHCMDMVHCKVQRQMHLFLQYTTEDEDLESDVHFVADRLKQALLDMSSFEEYALEVRSEK